MSEAKIANTRPCVTELEAGTHWWCSCGFSTHQPFCDGKHKGTEFKPKKLVLTEKRRVAFCQCKQTENGPFCDGAHNNL